MDLGLKVLGGRVVIGVTLGKDRVIGLYRDKGKYNGNCYIGFRV